MMILPPKSIIKKVRYSNNDVVVRDGVKLTPEEQEIFTEFRKELKKAIEDRFK